MNHDAGISGELRRDVRVLGEMLGDAIQQLMGEETFECVEELRSKCLHGELDDAQTTIEGLAEEQLRNLLRAFTTYFRLVNQAEQVEIERINRRRSTENSADRPDSIAAAIGELAESGCGFEGLRDLLCRLDIQPTLTAHPTEARRRTTLELQESIGRMVSRLRQQLTAGERRATNDRLQALIRTLLATDEVPSQRRSVEDEIRFGIHFLAGSIWNAVPAIHRDLRAAVRDRFDRDFDVPAFLQHRNWIGGDRDGNPNVTPEVTRHAFEEQRRIALQRHIDAMVEIRRGLSASERLIEVPAELRRAIERDAEREPLPEDLATQFRNEPFRTRATCVIRALHATLENDRDDYDARQFVEDLEVLHQAAVEVFGEPFREGPLRDALVRARTFGFHLAPIDFRQHAAKHRAAVDELLTRGGVTDGYGDADEQQKEELLCEELRNPRPLVGSREELSDDTAQLLETFDAARDAFRRDPASVGAWIVSMTHAPSAILEVLLLAKQTGLWSWNEGEVESPLDVVPLVETVEDLQHADSLMNGLFSLECYRRHLAARGGLQEVMLGYSDSNKDGGYWAANAALYDAQQRIARACDEHGVEHRLFHGRGGTVGRGGGRTNRAIFSLPPETRTGRIRFTEQGEIISFRYANEALASRHLEQVVHATLLTAARPEENRPPEGADEVLSSLAERARKEYRDLIDPAEFWTWYRQTTPIEHISDLPIASRPVSRAEGELQFEDLRAIPWNFAWTQTRYCVPGWFGLQVVGSDGAPDTDALRNLRENWDFFRSVTDNAELEMARARLSIARIYDELSEVSLHDELQEAFERARAVLLEITGHSQLLERDPVIRESIELRNPYTDVLNLIQVELLRRSRKTDGRDTLDESILLSLNGVAAAMQSTG